MLLLTCTLILFELHDNLHAYGDFKQIAVDSTCIIISVQVKKKSLHVNRFQTVPYFHFVLSVIFFLLTKLLKCSVVPFKDEKKKGV